MTSPRPEIPVARGARQRFELDGLLSAGGRVDLGDLGRVRRLAQALNAGRAAGGRGVRAGELHALGLIHQLLRQILADYRRRHGDVLRRALEWLIARHGKDRVERLLRIFDDVFGPPPAAGEGPAAGERPPEAVLEDLLVLWLIHDNPAAEPLRELVDDGELEAATGYRSLIAELEDFFARQPPADDGGSSLFARLRQPAQRAPSSLSRQLEAMLEERRPRPAPATERILLGLDLMREEERPLFVPGPPPPPPVHDFADLEGSAARYAADASWMTELVLVAKNVLVWLEQLSRARGEPIRRLDQIPQAELERLAGWGINGLWLIGVWQRSRASARIKQLTGNPDAVASAYAIDEYRVADALGGEEALAVLASRAARAGLRLACDMVPNHTGIDSRWLLEHPERFLALDRSPFPGYSFDGPDLSPDPRVAIHLEDGYYDRSDAAVVFRRRDRTSGETRYVYHGNDGTGLPWNDTAQLDFLRPDTRQAVIETILEVARRFPIIRFDAAMTLARQHVQRLWHPPPGSGGDVPSRAEHAVSPEEFDRAMPEELWRQVVERVAQEAPGPLLLAEAFWLMEAYFVRTLGLHRVYHSAFMHMLRDGKNGELRQLIKNALAFDPAMLQRFVNFLTNPDEATAAEQFGRGDRYFSAAVLLATFPGLPLFGHGQIEGLVERYGMEYHRPRLDERPDEGMIAHHRRVLVPLLERRALFASADGFELYDVAGEGGEVLEDVYAFSNRHGGEGALVLVCYRAAAARGRLHRAAPRRDAGGETRRATLFAALFGGAAGGGEGPDGEEDLDDLFVRFRDLHRELDYLRPAAQLAAEGLAVDLGPYEFRVLVDFRLLRDADGSWRKLWRRLGERGAPSLADALRSTRLADLELPLLSIFDPQLFRRLAAPASEAEAADAPASEAEAAEAPPADLDGDAALLALPLAEQVARRLEAVLAVVASHPALELAPGPGAARTVAAAVAAR
ncbi:MAG: alpha-amylase, partial [Acidobacteria bacterium]